MARESLYPFTINQEEFLLELAAAPGPISIPDLLKRTGEYDSELAKRARYAACEQLAAKHLIAVVYNLERQGFAGGGSTAGRIIDYTELGALITINHLIDKRPRMDAAEEGLNARFDFE